MLYGGLVSETRLRRAFESIKGLSVPNMPDVVIQVSQEIAGPNTDAGRVADLITSDIALAGNVLRLANSPLYRRRAEIQSVEHAIMMLGLEKLKNLVVASALKHALAQDNVDYRHIVEDSQAVALCAAGIAASVEGVAAEDAYLGGLFHDAGMLLLAQKFEDYLDFVKVWEADPIGVLAAEEEQFGTDHCVVGFILAKHWAVPEVVCHAISQHHAERCDHIKDQSLRGHIGVLKLARYLRESTVGIHAADSMPETWMLYRNSAIEELALDSESIGDFRTLCLL